MRVQIALLFFLALWGALGTACSSGDYGLAPYYEDNADFGADEDAPDGSAQSSPPPPDESVALATPTTIDQFVLVPDREGQQLLVLNADDLSAQALGLDGVPEQVIAMDDGQRFVAFVGDPASIVVFEQPDYARNDISLRPGMNQVALDPGTGNGIAYIDPDATQIDDQVFTLGEVTLFSVETGESTTLSVGDRVNRIRFNSTDGTAVIATRFGLYFVDFSDLSVEYVRLDTAIVETLLVSVGGSVSRAIARHSGTELSVVDFPSTTVSSVVLPWEPIDMDLASSVTQVVGIADAGTSATHYFALDTGSLALTYTTLSEDFDALFYNSDSQLALLRSSASAREVYWYSSGTLEYRELQLPVQNVLFSSNTEFAIVQHSPCSCARDSFYAQTEAISIIDFFADRITPIRLSERLRDVSFSDRGNYLFARFNKAQQAFGLHLPSALVMSGLRDQNAQFIGPLPDPQGSGDLSSEFGRMFVLEDHPYGKMSVIEVDAIDADFVTQTQSVTGFNLNARIEQ